MDFCIETITDEVFNEKSIPFNNPKIRHGARGIIVRSDGKIALFFKENKNEYKLPGGGIDQGENPREAFLREALEETGCIVEIIEELGTIEEHKSLDNFKQISHIFVANVIKDTGSLNLTEKEQEEGSKLLWFDKEAALEKITNSFNNLKASKYEDLYHSKFINYRDRKILEKYIELNKKITK